MSSLLNLLSYTSTNLDFMMRIIQSEDVITLFSNFKENPKEKSKQLIAKSIIDMIDPILADFVESTNFGDNTIDKTARIRLYLFKLTAYLQVLSQKNGGIILYSLEKNNKDIREQIIEFCKNVAVDLHKTVNFKEHKITSGRDVIYQVVDYYSELVFELLKTLIGFLEVSEFDGLDLADSFIKLAKELNRINSNSEYSDYRTRMDSDSDSDSDDDTPPTPKESRKRKISNTDEPSAKKRK